MWLVAAVLDSAIVQVHSCHPLQASTSSLSNGNNNFSVIRPTPAANKQGQQAASVAQWLQARSFFLAGVTIHGHVSAERHSRIQDGGLCLLSHRVALVIPSPASRKGVRADFQG